MAHNLEMINGQGSLVTTKVAWHGLGEVVEGAMTWAEAMEKAKLNWEVVKRNLFDNQTQTELPVYGIFRNDNQQFLGAVGERYTPIQNKFQFDFMDEVLGSGNAHYETAGVLGNGEKVFMSANLSTTRDICGTGDKISSYLVGVGSHDGSSSQRFFVSTIRPVCQNTVQASISQANGKGVKVRHTANAERNLRSKLGMLQNSQETFDSLADKLEILAQRIVPAEVIAKTVAEIFGITDLTKEIPTRTVNAISTVQELFEKNDGDAFPEFRGTAYNLLNGVTEYVDHHKEVRMTSGRAGMTEEIVRAESAMFGLGADFKSNALDLILDNTANCRTRSINKTYSTAGVGVLDAVLNQYS